MIEQTTKASPRLTKQTLSPKKGLSLFGPSYIAVDDASPTSRILTGQLWWRIVHVAGGLLGGIAFIVGTAIFYYPSWLQGPLVAAVLYIFGSFAFFCVDILDFFTFERDIWVRVNICLSVLGCFLKVFGSIGFLPVIYDVTPLIGMYGFLIGSLCICCSSVWRCLRILRGPKGTCANRNTAATLAVECCAGFGAFCFFLGTAMFIEGPLEGTWYLEILDIWIVGSCSFTTGSLLLSWHYFCVRQTTNPILSRIKKPPRKWADEKSGDCSPSVEKPVDSSFV